MPEDWATVARAINERLTELDLSQRDLIMRSRVSKAVVREIQHHTVERRRSTRTLEALSTALEWHPGHLAAVLEHRKPPEAGEPLVRSEEDIPGRLSAIEYRLEQITARLDEIGSVSDQLAVLRADIAKLAEHIEQRRVS